MGLTFLTGDFPLDWIAATPNTIAEIRATLDPTELPASFLEAISSILDQVTELMQPGDQLYKFTSPPETWEKKMGTAGYVIIRNGAIVHRVMSAMN